LTPGDSVLFYTSPYKRTRQTLEGIKSELSDVKYKVYEEPRMREQDFGNFQSDSAIMEKIWLERAHYGHFFYRIPYGESAADVYDRVSGFNETLFRQFQSDEFPSVLVLITHGIWARVFLMKWYRWTYEEFESLKNVPHCQLIKMERDDRGKFKLKTKLYKWDEEENEGGAESSYEKDLRKEKERELRERFNR
jgi:broad specificity phosphatase PhoE